LTSARVV